MSNVFFVGSALEYLNAVEARHAFDIPPSQAHLLVLQTYELHKRGRDLQVPAILDPQEWATVEIFTRPRRSVRETLRVLRALEASVRRWPRVERLFLGGYLSVMRRHVANRLAYDELVLLDEGVSTLHVHALRRRRRAGFAAADERILLPRRRDRWLRGGPLRALLLRTLGIRDRHPPRVTYFTIYPLEPAGEDRVVQHAYPFWRQRAASLPCDASTWFLGEPLCEEKLLADPAHYDVLLEAVRATTSAGDLVYKPHRHEDPQRVAQLVSRHGMRLCVSTLPVELLLLRGPERPSRLASAYSSALANCGLLFGDALDIECWVLPAAALAPAHRTHLAAVEAFYRRHDAVHVRPLGSPSQVRAASSRAFR